jgi:hypothetical protein
MTAMLSAFAISSSSSTDKERNLSPEHNQENQLHYCRKIKKFIQFKYLHGIYLLTHTGNNGQHFSQMDCSISQHGKIIS